MSAILELRRYTLVPGRRDELVTLFDREFVEPQEALGMRLVGQFRDLDDADQFVWLRGFADRASRKAGLAAFYGGPVWQAHRAAANATMVDSSNVLLLEPAAPDLAFPPAADRAADPAGSPIMATIYELDHPVDDRLLARFRTEIGPRAIAAYRTLDIENDFPALPVRRGLPVFAWFGRGEAAAFDVPGLARPPTVLRLAPTGRSSLR